MSLTLLPIDQSESHEIESEFQNSRKITSCRTIYTNSQSGLNASPGLPGSACCDVSLKNTENIEYEILSDGIRAEGSIDRVLEHDEVCVLCVLQADPIIDQDILHSTIYSSDRPTECWTLQEQCHTLSISFPNDFRGKSCEEIKRVCSTVVRKDVFPELKPLSEYAKGRPIVASTHNLEIDHHGDQGKNIESLTNSQVSIEHVPVQRPPKVANPQVSRPYTSEVSASNVPEHSKRSEQAHQSCGRLNERGPHPNRPNGPHILLTEWTWVFAICRLDLRAVYILCEKVRDVTGMVNVAHIQLIQRNCLWDEICLPGLDLTWNLELSMTAACVSMQYVQEYFNPDNHDSACSHPVPYNGGDSSGSVVLELSNSAFDPSTKKKMAVKQLWFESWTEGSWRTFGMTLDTKLASLRMKMVTKTILIRFCATVAQANLAQKYPRLGFHGGGLVTPFRVKEESDNDEEVSKLDRKI